MPRRTPYSIRLAPLSGKTCCRYDIYCRILVKHGKRKGELLKRFTLGLTAAAFALSLAGCGGESGNQTDGDGKQAQESPNPEQAESQEAEERAALNPEDFSGRILSLDDLPGGFELDDEVEFGETEEQSNNPFDSDSDSSGTDSTQTECIVGAMATHSSELDGVSAARNFNQSADNSGSFIMTSLSRPSNDSKQMLEGLRDTVDECQTTINAEPTESVKVFEPSGNKGEGFCATTYSGTFVGQGKIVASECYIAWAGELMTIHNMAFEAETSLAIDEEAMDGVTEYMNNDLLPKALTKADMAAS